MQSVGKARLESAWRTYERLYLVSLAKRSRRSYRCAANRFLEVLPDPFTLSDLLLWRARMVEERRLAPSYINQAIKIMRGMTRRASHVTGDIELASLFVQVATLPEAPRTPRCPPPDYVSRIIGAARNPAERAFVLLTALAGLRRDEVLGLMPEDWNSETGVLQVIRQRNREVRKNGRPHAVTVNSKALRRWLDWTVAHHAEIIPVQGPPVEERASAPFLFPWTHHYLELFVDRIREHLGDDVARYMPKGTAWHAGRHWGTTELAKKGAPLFDIQSWRGDADTTATAIYVVSVRGATAGSVSDLETTWRRHDRCRGPAPHSKSSRCAAATPHTGRRHRRGDDTSRSRGLGGPKGHHLKGGPCEKPTSNTPRGRED